MLTAPTVQIALVGSDSFCQFPSASRPITLRVCAPVDIPLKLIGVAMAVSRP